MYKHQCMINSIMQYSIKGNAKIIFFLLPELLEIFCICTFVVSDFIQTLFGLFDYIFVFLYEELMLFTKANAN